MSVFKYDKGHPDYFQEVERQKQYWHDKLCETAVKPGVIETITIKIGNEKAKSFSLLSSAIDYIHEYFEKDPVITNPMQGINFNFTYYARPYTSQK